MNVFTEIDVKLDTFFVDERSFKNLFFQSSHIHLTDALMMAYTAEMISIEKAVSSVTRFANISASKELPYDLEDSMIFWINKVMTDITLQNISVLLHQGLFSAFSASG